MENLNENFDSYDEFKEYVVAKLAAYEKDCLDYAMWAYKHNFLGVKGEIVNPVKKLKTMLPPEVRRDYYEKFAIFTMAPYCRYLKRHNVKDFIIGYAPDEFKNTFNSDFVYNTHYDESSEPEWTM